VARAAGLLVTLDYVTAAYLAAVHGGEARFLLTLKRREALPGALHKLTRP